MDDLVEQSDYIEYYHAPGTQYHQTNVFRLVRTEETPTPLEVAAFINKVLERDDTISCRLWLPSQDANYQFMLKVAAIVAPWQFKTCIQEFGNDWDSEYTFVTADQKRKL